jgi:hypothetical protein
MKSMASAEKTAKPMWTPAWEGRRLKGKPVRIYHPDELPFESEEQREAYRVNIFEHLSHFPINENGERILYASPQCSPLSGQRRVKVEERT